MNEADSYVITLRQGKQHKLPVSVATNKQDPVVSEHGNPYDVGALSVLQALLSEEKSSINRQLNPTGGLALRKKVRARALRQQKAIENLLTDATQQPLEFYNSRLSAQAATVTPVVSPVVLLGESACRAASTAPSPAACSNELLEILNGLDTHTVEVDDAVSLRLDSEYGLL